MANYLYGAAVQGIQGFIFQTNRLKDIGGASELVERICTSLFAELLYENNDNKSGLLERLASDENAILNAAGNIKYIFTNEEECRRIVASFPKRVMEFAPGVTISQSVVRIEGNNFHEAVQNLEANLRTQRNKPMRDLSTGLIGIIRSRETGLPATHNCNGDYFDSATYHKRYEDEENDEEWRNTPKDTFGKLARKAFGDDNVTRGNLPEEISKMTGSNDWIAIIHADGNGLGQVVQKIGSDKRRFKEFSRKLDEATTEAAVKAARKILDTDTPSTYGKVIPMRPIVLSGDDHTIICRGDLAIPYTTEFLKAFEETSRNLLADYINGVFRDGADHLTACAGIVFVKSSFPFYFGYSLAEALCDRAKKDSKALFKAAEGNLPASALMFHKVQDSFISDFGEIVRRELTPQENISFEFGPYYLSATSSLPEETLSGRWTIDTLTSKVGELDGEDGNAVKSGLRQWLSLLHDDPHKAAQRLERLKKVAPTAKRDFISKVTDGRAADGTTIYPVYDMLVLHTIDSQVTR